MRYAKRLIGALAFLLGAGGLQAQQPASQACTDPGSTLLWKVEGYDKDVHLFGSIHVGKPDFYPLPQVVEQAFQEAERLVFEVDPASAGNPAAAVAIQQRGQLPPGESLADRVSADTLARLHEVLGGMGVPAEQVMTMQPWLLALLLTSVQVTREGYLPQFGVEFYLYNRRPRSTEVLELESLEEQLGFLESLDAESFLRYTLEGMGPESGELERLTAAWRCADHPALAAMLFPSAEDLDDPALRADLETLMVTLFHGRNQAMAADIQALAQDGEGDLFVVVGAGHLLGEGSVVDLLGEAGLQVTPVRSTP